MKVAIIFTKDFGTRKKDEVITCDSMQASRLIRVDKVAKLHDVKESKAKPKAKAKKSK